ncbi:low molecular weight protein-tyrosine-phosphatase [Paenibacillus sp. P22]|uniref:low molecular weight protein-tyrosine-phosphatase n=1 Tax=Paenibacillus sp. P22 TaxID=483908 RepID=UPI00041EE4AE|nr:low molecular weight protein-tyrosine-phosphatase [Paenibacillus sp. P22]
MADNKKTKVLFVCLGNICRSPMAEAVLRHKAEEQGLGGIVEAGSCGTGDWHLGHSPHEGTRRMLDAAGISCQGMISTLVSRQALEQADYIVCMDEKNEQDVRELLREWSIEPDGELLRFMELLPGQERAGVPDPYYTGDFEETFRLVKEGCDRLLSLIKNDQARLAGHARV